MNSKWYLVVLALLPIKLYNKQPASYVDKRIYGQCYRASYKVPRVLRHKACYKGAMQHAQRSTS